MIVRMEGREYVRRARERAIEQARAALTVEQAEEEAHLIASLKPCPCCGGRADMSTMHSANVEGHKWLAHIYCTKCNLAQMGGYGTAEEARDAWNRRTEA